MDVMQRACSPAHPLETEALRPKIFGCVHSPRATARPYVPVVRSFVPLRAAIPRKKRKVVAQSSALRLAVCSSRSTAPAMRSAVAASATAISLPRAALHSGRIPSSGATPAASGTSSEALFTASSTAAPASTIGSPPPYPATAAEPAAPRRPPAAMALSAAWHA
eukprot:scaffold1496_cov110-Isochrysis_galbana.AAC.3